jgi:tRNA U34 5-methylaminomethyl-2-thiouridine-forming methyltransferase MnmC
MRLDCRVTMYREDLREKKELIITGDGTKTLFSCEFNETYHSTRDGALYESMEKHVKPAFRFQKDKSTLVILDICFGLGYNTLATLFYIREHNLSTKLHIISPELDKSLIESLSSFDYPKEFDEFKNIIKELSQNFYYEDNQFKIEILIGDARVLIPKISKKIDILYQDAFSPKQNPLLWTKEYFADIRALSSEDIIITTYSTAITTRMGLYENGYSIFLFEGKDIRPSTIASLKMLDIKYIDMELKKSRNLNAKSLRDSNLI